MGGGIELIPPPPARIGAMGYMYDRQLRWLLAENKRYVFIQFASHRTHLSRGARELRFASAEDTSGVGSFAAAHLRLKDRRLTANQRCIFPAYRDFGTSRITPDPSLTLRISPAALRLTPQGDKPRSGPQDGSSCQRSNISAVGPWGRSHRIGSSDPLGYASSSRGQAWVVGSSENQNPRTQPSLLTPFNTSRITSSYWEVNKVLSL